MVDDLLNSTLSRRTVVKASLVAPAAAMLPVGLGSVAAQDAFVATMVTDTAGLGDQNFNDLANKGGEQAKAELGVDWKVIESADQAAYEPNLTAAAENSNVVVGVGFLLLEAITTVATQFPDQKFVLIDAVSDAPNVQGVTYSEEQLGFIAGVIAGKCTKTNKIGVIDGVRIPPVIRYEVGFVAGVKSVNPDAAVEINVTGVFGDAPLGKITAAAMFNNGADIVFPIAGLTGTGAYAAAAELNKPGEVWVIGVDTTQDHLAPGYELCVVNKGVDFGVFTGIKEAQDGTFKGGAVNYDLASGGISFSVYDDRPSAEFEGLALAYQAMLIDGSLVAPVDDDALKAFVPPAVPEPLEVPAEASPTA